MTISDVQCKNGQYYVYDEDSQEVKTFWESEGELVGFGQDFVVFERNEQYRFLQVESGDEMGSVWQNSVGRFKQANGNLAVFERNDQVYTHKVSGSGVSEISNRWK